MRLVRYIHPVGQGAFYTEQFFNDENEKIATVVYDCGAEKNLSGIKHEVHGMFDKNEEIDLLFISHFHSDHINGIVELKKRTKVKNVIIPLYELERQLLLLATVPSDRKNDKTYQELEKLIKNPGEFFGNDTRVIKVKRVDNETKGILGDNQDVINLDEMPSRGEIESGRRVACTSFLPFWEYIPYNFKYQERHDEFENECSIKHISLNNLQKDIGKKEFLSDLKSVYAHISPKNSINENSMMVYSGQCYKPNDDSDWDELNACLYTGDSTIKEEVIKDLQGLLTYRCSRLSVLQIPHHASKDSFDIKLFELIKHKDCDPVLFVSLGNKNTYGHPSSYVITQCNLFLRHHHPYWYYHYLRQCVRMVSEDKSSMLVLLYEFKY